MPAPIRPADIINRSRVLSLMRHERYVRDMPDAILPPPDEVHDRAVSLYKCCIDEMGSRRDVLARRSASQEEEEEIVEFKRDNSHQEHRAAFECAAYLYPAIDYYGIAFSQLINVANERTARLLVQISSDLAYDERMRHTLLKSRAGKAELEAKLILLAVIDRAAVHLSYRAIPDTLPGIRSLVAWYNERKDLLEAINSVRSTPAGPAWREQMNVMKANLTKFRPMVDMTAAKRAERARVLNRI